MRRKKIWQATQAEWAGVMLSVAGEMVTHFINLRLVQEKLDILYERSKSQLGIVRSVESRRQTDAGSSLQVSQALTLYYSILAEFQSLRMLFVQRSTQLPYCLGYILMI